MDDIKIDFPSIIETDCFFNVRKTSRIVTQAYDFAFREIGITSSQFILLAAVENNNGNTLMTMAENLDMDRTTLSRNLVPLKIRHWVENNRIKDRRKTSYTLSETGRKKLQQAYVIWKPLNEKIINAIQSDRYNDILLELDYLSEIIPAACNLYI